MNIYRSLANMPLSIFYPFMATRDPMILVKTPTIPTRHIPWALQKLSKELDEQFFPAWERFEWGIQHELWSIPEVLKDELYNRSCRLWKPLLNAKLDPKGTDWTAYWEAGHALVEIKSGDEIPLKTTVTKFIEIINQVSWPYGNDYTK